MIRFLQKPGRVQKWLLTGILLFVSIAMVWYLVPQGNSEDVNTPNILATVGEAHITLTDAQTAAEQWSRNNGRQFPNALMPQLVEALITDKAELLEAHRLGLRVSDEELRDELQHGAFGQALFPNGQFVGQERYQEFVNQQLNTTVEKFEDQERSYLLENKLFNLVTSAVAVTPAEIQRAYLDQNTKVKLQYAVITPAAETKDINPSESELRAYYQTHKVEYVNSIPEKRKAKYVAIDLAKLQSEAQVSREELLNYYDQHREEFRRPEEVKASHILIKVAATGPNGKVDAQADAAARAKAEGILKQLKAGANFAELAKKYSDDKASAINGGSLGWFQHGAMVPEFEKAAFSLPVGEISGLVKTQFGYHIIKVEDKHAAGIPSVDEVKDKIEPLLKQEKAQRQAQTLADAVYNQARSGSLDAAAAAHSLQVVTTDWFARTDSLPGIGNAPEFMDAAFNTSAGAPAQEVGTQTGYVVFRITGAKPAATPSYDEIKAKVEQEFKQERAAQLVMQKTQEMSDRAHALHDLAKAAKEVGAEMKTSDLLGENGQAPELGNMGGPARVAFDLKVGEISGPLSVNGNGAVLMVTDRQEPAMADLAKSQDQIRDQLLNQKKREAQELFLAGLTQRLEAAGKIKKNQQQIAAYTRSSGL